MKYFSLVTLISFTLILQGVSPIIAADYSGAAAAQKYVNSAQGMKNSANVQLEGVYRSLSEGILPEIETALCGIASPQINASGEYTNCTGGAVGEFNSWKKAIEYWSPTIANLSNGDDVDSVISACNAGMSGTSYTTTYNNGVGFFADMETFMSGSGSSSGFKFLSVVDELASKPSASNHYRPSRLTLATGLLSNMNRVLDGLADSIASKEITNLTQAAMNAYNKKKASESAFSTCYSENYSKDKWKYIWAYSPSAGKNAWLDAWGKYVGGSWAPMVYDNYAGGYNASGQWEQYNASGQNTPSNCAMLAPCSAVMEEYLEDYESYSNSMIALFTELLQYQPYINGDYERLTLDDAWVTGCVLPSKCGTSLKNNDPSTCQYSVPSFSFASNTDIQNITKTISDVNSLVQGYKTKLVDAQTRLNAIIKQVGSLASGISEVMGSSASSTALTADQKDLSSGDYSSISCSSTDFKPNTMNYVSCLCDLNTAKHAEDIQEAMMITKLIVGGILGIGVVALSGGVGIAGLETLVQVLTMIPPINNATIGKISSLISAPIAKSIVDGANE